MSLKGGIDSRQRLHKTVGSWEKKAGNIDPSFLRRDICSHQVPWEVSSPQEQSSAGPACPELVTWLPNDLLPWPEVWMSAWRAEPAGLVTPLRLHPAALPSQQGGREKLLFFCSLISYSQLLSTAWCSLEISLGLGCDCVVA